MTQYQVIAIALLLTVGIATALGPKLVAMYNNRPSSPKPKSLDAIESIVRIRDASTDKEVIASCNALLHALLQVAP